MNVECPNTEGQCIFDQSQTEICLLFYKDILSISMQPSFPTVFERNMVPSLWLLIKDVNDNNRQKMRWGSQLRVTPTQISRQASLWQHRTVVMAGVVSMLGPLLALLVLLMSLLVVVVMVGGMDPHSSSPSFP